MCRRSNGLRRRRPTRMTAPPAPGGSKLPAGRENLVEFFGGSHFALVIGTFPRAFVGAPAAKLRHVAEAAISQVLIDHGDHQLGPQWNPRKVLSLTPATF